MVSAPSMLAVIGVGVCISHGPVQETDAMPKGGLGRQCDKETFYKVSRVKEGEAPKGSAMVKKPSIDHEGQGKVWLLVRAGAKEEGAPWGLWPQRKVATVRLTIAVQESVGRIEAPSLCLPASPSPFGTTNWKPEAKGS